MKAVPVSLLFLISLLVLSCGGDGEPQLESQPIGEDRVSTPTIRNVKGEATPCRPTTPSAALAYEGQVQAKARVAVNWQGARRPLRPRRALSGVVVFLGEPVASQELPLDILPPGEYAVEIFASWPEGSTGYAFRVQIEVASGSP